MIFILISSCSNLKKSEYPKYNKAELQALIDTSHKVVKKYKGFKIGGGGVIEHQPIVHKNVECKWVEKGIKNALHISFKDDSAYIEGFISYLQLPKNWSGYKYLKANFKNLSTQNIVCRLEITGARGRMPKSILIQPGKAETITLNLRDIPLIMGDKPPYEPYSIKITASPSAGKPEYPVSLKLSDLKLVQTSDTSKKPVVDQFGQRINDSWYNKIDNKFELKKSKKEEKALLNEFPSSYKRDRYGGLLTSGKIKQDNEYFSVLKKNGKYWFVTPSGYPFWSLGSTCVRPKSITSKSDLTKVEGRKFLFDTLPTYKGKWTDAYSDSASWFSFYYWNLLRKYQNLEEWKERVYNRYNKWGMNTFGNWTHPMFLNNEQVPYTRNIRTKNSQYSLSNKKGFRMPDVFNGQWKNYIDSLFKEKIQPHKKEKYLLGYFVDNEMDWQNPHLLKADLKTDLREVWLRLIKTKYTSIEAVNQAWNSSYNSWEDIRKLRQDNKPANNTFKKDYLKLKVKYANQYFKTINNKLKKYDPNHLYLGCRFTKFLPEYPELGNVFGKYIDVITINIYSFKPGKKRLTRWHEITQKPILIGEHHLPLKSQRQLPANYPVFPPEVRKQYYINYVKSFANMPFSLGCHWYQYHDQELTGRHDGENQTIGLVDITDQPHRELMNALKVIGPSFYEWHKK